MRKSRERRKKWEGVVAVLGSGEGGVMVVIGGGGGSGGEKYCKIYFF